LLQKLSFDQESRNIALPKNQEITPRPRKKVHLAQESRNNASPKNQEITPHPIIKLATLD
jgi:hypothetical protein